MTGTGPLCGLVVVDLTRVLAGPFATMMLADLGAHVVKVELPGTGDDAREFGPFIQGKSAYFMSLNRGKESIALDLKNDSDRGKFEGLITRADILIENFRPGTMENLGYGWCNLQTLNKRLIYAAISGFGQTGPYANRAAYDMVVQAMGGIMSITGHPDGAPVRVGTSVGDITAGLFGLSGILASVIERERTGKGTMIDVGMMDCQVAILENAVSRFFADDEIPGPIGARHPSITPFDSFKAKDGYFVICAGNQRLFEKLSAALGRDDLATNPAFATNSLRTQNHEMLKIEIETALSSGTCEEWIQIIGGADVPCGPINNIAKLVKDPHVRARNMIVEVDDPDVGRVRMAGNPIKFSNHKDSTIRQPAPSLDADRKHIISGLLDDN